MPPNRRRKLTVRHGCMDGVLQDTACSAHWPLQASQSDSASSSAAAQAGSSAGGGRHRPWDSVRSLSPRHASGGTLRFTSSGGDSDDELEGYRRGANPRPRLQEGF